MSNWTHSPGVLSLIVSDRFYANVIQHNTDCYPEAYAPVEVIVKETHTKAWLRASVEAV